MRFQVPQFIEIESKIFGPLTLKQFIYLAGGAGITVVLFSFLPKFFAIIFSAPIVIFSIALAFYKVNNRPFISFIESALKYLVNSKLYIWKKIPKKIEEDREAEDDISVFVPKLSQSKLKELTWSLDVKENVNPVTKEEEDELT